jgi:hypothetical protein
MGVKELDVGTDVRTEIAPLAERDGNRLEPPDGQRGEEDDEQATARLRHPGRAVQEGFYPA